MARDFNNKSIEGITDLVVVAPIKEGFIAAFDNITYATRLKLVAEALNRVRVSAREHERVTPFSDVTERILTLLDFRIGVLDKDLFSLHTRPNGPAMLETRRYLYLTATFDGAWEPYMRLIWDPLGPFLDLLFCNCEGYVTAVDHSFEEYAQWVRDNQLNSATFYATSGLTVRDGLYLSQLEKLQRKGADPLALAEMLMPQPEAQAATTRIRHFGKALELGLEALTVMYRLADYYPPQWMMGGSPATLNMQEGHRLWRVASELLKGWDGMTALLANQAPPPGIPPALAAAWSKLIERWQQARRVYAEPLKWYETGLEDHKTRQAALTPRPDPDFNQAEVQAGIVESPGPRVRHGALMLFSIRNSLAGRAFLQSLPINYAGDDAPADGVCCTVGLTADGLRRLGLEETRADLFPREFREGMAARSGLIGDMRENHPRNWILPERNGPVLAGKVPAGTRLPPVELSEIDIVVQLRSTGEDSTPLEAKVQQLARQGDGVALQAVEWLNGAYAGERQRFTDHFGFVDGISQPRPVLPGATQPAGRDAVKLGEILLGYGNDRTDPPPGPYKTLKDWRCSHRKAVQQLQLNGTFQVLRKIGTDAEAFEKWINESVSFINKAHSLAKPMTAERLKSLILGRAPDGTPLLTSGGGGDNDFDFGNDQQGRQCPLASHVRRANPRRTLAGTNPANQAEFGRPTPRILRRGLRFGAADQASKGLMFIAYNASIAEQYEVIQRWLNGGNSTGIASAHNDPLTGVQPEADPGVFRFTVTDSNGNQIPIAIPLPSVLPGDGPNAASEPGRHPFAPLHWGLYLFVPSRSGIAMLTALKEDYRILQEPLELVVGKPIMERLQLLESNTEEAANELKRLLEDIDAKDPAEGDLTPSLWAAIRYYDGGARKFSFRPAGSPPHDWQQALDASGQDIILCASRSVVRQVLAEWPDFSTEEQLRRIAPNSGPIFVTQQPDNQYRNTRLQGLGLNYASDAHATNTLLMGYSQDAGFQAGHAAGKQVLGQVKKAAMAAGRTSAKLELRRQYLLPALGALCHIWYGLPDGQHMEPGGWNWDMLFAASGQQRKARCPGDFLSPSRHAFYPRPSRQVAAFADDHGKAILAAAEAFVATHRKNGTTPAATVANAMFKAIKDDAVLARNLVGTMVGAIPPMDGNLRGILYEWLDTKSLWRHQAALREALCGQTADTNVAAAISALYEPVSQAMCKRPAPDLLYRTATRSATIRLKDKKDGTPRHIDVKEGDLLVISQVSAAQRTLLKFQQSDTGKGDVSLVFGGRRERANQGYAIDAAGQVTRGTDGTDLPVHACPAQNMAMGAIMGIVAALLEVGTIQALPASLIVKLSWNPNDPQAPG